MTTEAVNLPIIDLSSSDSISSANSIRQACIEYGFFYLVNHGVEEELFAEVFDRSRNFFSLPLEDKLKLTRKHHRGYTPLFMENLDFASSSKDILPSWRPAMELYYRKVLSAGKRLISLIALALNLDEDFFEKVGALNKPRGLLRLLHYPGELGSTDEEIYGASAHSDYGMVTLLASNGVPGLQVCRDKSKQPRIWEDVLHIDGAFIVNIGDMMERWTNCLFRSTLHRVMPAGQERYSVAFFMDPNEDCVVECLKSCCSEESPARFPPVRSGDYLEERFRLTYAT
ncbi:kihadalactone A synthase LFS-like isoform X2 [Malus domestica]|uniref:kihadalactone A synthase LFS-like isoform X2 n=1 Tax=Malus domestica TaxID=3750 RepID=UPI0010A9E47B|nr:2-oxoglutarate-Fe(II) type oxidoreductase hxnY-like isoform X2 [Malus domestica]